MSTVENKALVRRYYEEVVSTGDVRHLSDFVAGKLPVMTGVNVDRVVDGLMVEHGGAP